MDGNVPSELAGPLPRRVCATRRGFWTVTATAIISAFAIAATLWLGKNALQNIQKWQALRRDGSDTVGHVTRTANRKHLTVYYSFTVNGTSLTGKADAPKRLEQSLQDSSPLSIRYLPANPAVNHPADWEYGPSDSVWFILPFPIALSGILFLISLRMERTLVADGVPAAAVITRSDYHSRGGYTATYEFRTEDGRVMQKRVGVPNRLEIGSKIWVLYLRRNPRRSQPYPSPNYRVAE